MTSGNWRRSLSRIVHARGAIPRRRLRSLFRIVFARHAMEEEEDEEALCMPHPPSGPCLHAPDGVTLGTSPWDATPTLPVCAAKKNLHNL